MDIEQRLYEKIGRQEVIIEALKGQLSEVSSLLSKFISGEEKTEDWGISAQGQLTKKTPSPDKPKKPGRPKKTAKSS